MDACTHTPSILRSLAALFTAVALTACGGDNDSAATSPPPPAAPAPTPTPPPPAVATTRISGAVVKGPVNNATVCAFAALAAARGPSLGPCTTSGSHGEYSLSVPTTGPVWVEASGGNFTDEASGALTALPAGSVLAALVAGNTSPGSSTEVTAHLTPLTTLALNTAVAAANVSLTGFDQAASAWLSAFGLPATLDILRTLPVVSGSSNVYGDALATISRLVAAGTPLATVLAASQPAQLQAAYAAAAAPAPVPPVAGGGTDLSITGATPASLNGVLNAGAVQFEHGSSAETGGPYDDAQPYCRVAVYGLVGADGGRYFLEIPFRKDNRAFGLVNFGDDTNLATKARVLNPGSGISVDVASRRISFNNFTLAGVVTVTLNGSLVYPTNFVAGNRAACG